jgi:DnaJ-class molecular chaperone
MSELFKLKPCEECNGTGDAHHQGHDYDCPYCLGTGYEEPAKRIMNLELMLNQHKETLKSGDAYNNELAQKFEITLEQRDSYKERYTKLAGKYAIEMHEITEQRDSLAEEITQLKSQLTQTRGAVTISRNGYVQELEQQRDRLVEALLELRNSESFSLCGAAYEIIEKALQSLTPKR